MKTNILLALSLILYACTDESGSNSGANDTFELAGEWKTDFGSATITNTSWKEYEEEKVIRFDNTTNVAITQNPEHPSSDQIKPNLFLRTVWTDVVNDVTNVCIVDFDLATEAEALASSKTADAKDLEHGCNSFAWTKMTRK